MEYLLLLVDFFRIKKAAIILHILIPILVGISIYYCADNANYLKNANDFRDNTITVLGILIGFSISTFTVLLTVENDHIQKAKNEKLNKENPKSISLYESVLIGLAYLIIIQGFLLIFNFIYPVFILVDSLRGKLFFSINISCTIHVILLLMRNILDFYFIITRRE
jgi:hypothetical protein